ncbi:uncharacterized protein [Dendropsophus ebraccatus]|uniref:uncharacterized protein n=1 Tax=Dendropsophus ebraccatus TaxID=150705 RepID=UPI0038310D88
MSDNANDKQVVMRNVLHYNMTDRTNQKSLERRELQGAVKRFRRLSTGVRSSKNGKKGSPTSAKMLSSFGSPLSELTADVLLWVMDSLRNIALDLSDNFGFKIPVVGLITGCCERSESKLKQGYFAPVSQVACQQRNNISSFSCTCEKAEKPKDSETSKTVEEQLRSGNGLADWMIEKSKIQNHNGEYCLFTLGMLSTRKDEQLSGQPSLQSLKPSRAGREGQLYCRRAQSHRYLMASVSESAVNDLTIDLKPQITTYSVLFGRPTRSSLLRSAHQSACVSSSIPVERGLKKISSEACSGRASRQKGTMIQTSRVPNLNATKSGLQMMFLEETVHSFLIGARYNRNYLDSQAFQKYGLFVSRNEPKVSFLTQCSADHKKRLDQSKELIQQSLKLENSELEVLEKHSRKNNEVLI